jgi:hypothetical protein
MNTTFSMGVSWGIPQLPNPTSDYSVKYLKLNIGNMEHINFYAQCFLEMCESNIL